jgi:DNA-binding Lrp family transcriptional regulator
MLDNIDELILSTLSKNSRQDSKEIWDFLMGCGYTLTEEEIGSRIARLEAEGIIAGYTISVNSTNIQDIATSSNKARRSEEIFG